MLLEKAERAAATNTDLAGPCLMVIFGAAGDLTRRKLLPALLNLRRAGLLADEFGIVANARADIDDARFRERLFDGMAPHVTPPLSSAERQWFTERIRYVRGDFNDPALFPSLATTLPEADTAWATQGNHLYYFATPPEHFATIARGLASVQLSREEHGRWRRIIIEKPFGEDLESARALNHELLQALSESQIYRIDHYLGKDTVQNLMVLRFANGIFEPIWNRRYVDHVQITVAEADGVEGRGGYYDTIGALRDMVQNHLLQLLALVAMEPPNAFRGEAVRDERVKPLEAIRPFSASDVERFAVRGQYAEGSLNGIQVPAYRSEPSVDPPSNTDTFVAVKLRLDSWRWADVPFYLRTGKRLPKRVSEIAIEFKCAPVVMFREAGIGKLEPNLLIIRIQPDEGISLRFAAKVPTTKLQLGTVKMDFKYEDYFGSRPTTGYESLLYDCMHGDPTHFHRADMVEAGWRVVMPILEQWRRPPSNFPNYAAFTWGPEEATELMAADGRKWRRP